MVRAIRLLLNIHPGEGYKSFLFILLGLLWSIGAYGMFTISEGMFLEHIGADALPLTYIIVSICFCCLTGLLIWALKHISIKNLFSLLVTFWALSSLTLAICYPIFSDQKIYWYVFKVAGWIMPISIYICSWSFIDQYLDLQQGKRLFCIFNAVTFLGDATGSGILFCSIDRFGVMGLSLFYASLLILSLPMIFLISRRLPPLVEAHLDHAGKHSSLSFRDLVKKILSSRFTLLLLAFYFAMQILAIVTEFNYMSRFDVLLGSESSYQLTAFLGKCNMWIGLGNMVFGLFIYSRLVRKMGVQNLAVIAPLFFLLIFSLWYKFDGLMIAVFGVIGREGMVYTFDDNNLNLLISGVPTKIKNQIRITVESFFEPVGMLAGASLLFCLKGSSLFLAFMIALVAVALVLLLRLEYPKAIFSNLVASSIRFGKTALDWIPKKERRSFEFHLMSSLKRSDEQSRLLAFEYLLKMGNPSHLPRLLNHINLLSIPGKLKAIELLGDSEWATKQEVIDKLDRWRRVLPHPSVRSAIHFYFARHTILRPEVIMHDLHHDHLGLRAAAILSLKMTPHHTSLPSYYSLASEKLRQLLDSKMETEVCVGLEIVGREGNVENVEQALSYLQHPVPGVRRSAAKSLSLIVDASCSEYTSTLIQYLSTHREPKITSYLLTAIQKIGDVTKLKELILSSIHFRPNERQKLQKIILKMPHLSEDKLLEILQNRFIHERARLMAGKILARLNPPILRRHLFEIVQNEIERAYFYIYHLETVDKTAHPILHGALETGYHSVIDFVIQIIGASDSLDECEVLSHTLRSHNQKLRAQAIETLQKACSTRLFSLIEPLIDERSSEKKNRHYLKRGFIPLKLTQLLDMMAFSPSWTDQIVAVWLKAKLKTPDWKDLVRKKLEDNEEIFRHFAQELLEEDVVYHETP